MIWAFVAMLAVLVVILMGQAVTITSLRHRVAESEEIVSDLMQMTYGTRDTRRAYVADRLRIYASRWGKMMKENA
jgi:hypothetical protein